MLRLFFVIRVTKPSLGKRNSSKSGVSVLADETTGLKASAPSRRDYLPIVFSISVGSMTVGNPSTPTLAVFSFSSCRGYVTSEAVRLISFLFAAAELAGFSS
jgi:hypothetical protein